MIIFPVEANSIVIEARVEFSILFLDLNVTQAFLDQLFILRRVAVTSPLIESAATTAVLFSQIDENTTSVSADVTLSTFSFGEFTAREFVTFYIGEALTPYFFDVGTAVASATFGN